MNEYKPIGYMRGLPCTYLALPAVYDDSLSYLQQIGRVVAKVNEVVEFVNNFQSDVYEYVDQEVGKVKADVEIWVNTQITALQNKVDKQLAEAEQEMRNLKAYVDGALAETVSKIENDIAQLRAYVVTQLAELRLLIGTTAEETKAYVDAKIQEIIDMIPEITSVYVKSPLTGEVQPIQDFLDFANSVYLYYAFNCVQYNERHFTATEFDGIGWNCREYDWNGRKYFEYRNPFTGEWDSEETWLNDLTELHRGMAICADTYDDIGYSATAYDALQKEADGFDFYGFWIPELMATDIQANITALHPDYQATIAAHINAQDNGTITGMISVTPAGEPTVSGNYKLLAPLSRSNEENGTLKQINFLMDAGNAAVFDGWLYTVNNFDWIAAASTLTLAGRKVVSSIGFKYH